jgi:hypothetical protein
VGHARPPTINLLPGKHRLERTLELDRRPSGVLFVGHGSAVRTGGPFVGTPAGAPGSEHYISSWTMGDLASCDGCGSNIWKVNVLVGLNSWQMYVN